MARRNNNTATVTDTNTDVTVTDTVQEDTMNATDTNTDTVETVTETVTATANDNPLGLVFEAPPAKVAAPKRQKGAKRAAVVAELQKHPGQWAVVKRNLKYTTEATEWRKLGCEVRAGKPEGSDLNNIWARWPEGKAVPAAE